MTRDERWLLQEKYAGIESEAFVSDCARLARGEPVAYVIGWQPFLGLKIYLDSHPLIPRPETEWWAEKLIAELKRRETVQKNPLVALNFLDLCAGSGAIGCAVLAKLPHAEVYFGEIDPEHKTTIEKNIVENNLDASRSHIGVGDLFAPFREMEFDVIAINPPYIPSGRTLAHSVSDYEPHQALFSGRDGLDLMHRIAADLSKHLKPNGIVWIECDTEYIESARGLFLNQGFSAEVINDQYEQSRIIAVSFPHAR